jgi:shikimate dehydrogenase
MITPPPSARTRVFALIGHPVRHSLSPAMHNELFRRHGVDAVYVALDVAPSQADDVATAVRTLALAGCNLTVPFKERVLPGLDVLRPAAALAGAVNVVIREPDGTLVGHNTDGLGYVRALAEELGVTPEERSAAVLGAGGTGRAVAAALAEHRARAVTLYNRTRARAEAAAAALSPRFPHTRFDAAELTPEGWSARVEGHDLVVNCTSGEGAARVAALDVGGLPQHAVWTDANYWMADPPQLASCARRGIRIQRGIGMLMHQGALSYELFTGRAVDSGAIRGVLDVGGW